jgi:hypothetical protein
MICSRRCSFDANRTLTSTPADRPVLLQNGLAVQYDPATLKPKYVQDTEDVLVAKAAIPSATTAQAGSQLNKIFASNSTAGSMEQVFHSQQN